MYLLAQLVKNPPAMRETWVQSLGWEDPLEKEVATHSSTLAWKIPWMEEPAGLQSMGSLSQTQLSGFNSLCQAQMYDGIEYYNTQMLASRSLKR